MERHQNKSISREIFKIKKYYCSKCIYFDEDNYKCTKDKVYSKCFKNNEREPEGIGDYVK